LFKFKLHQGYKKFVRQIIQTWEKIIIGRKKDFSNNLSSAVNVSICSNNMVNKVSFWLSFLHTIISKFRVLPRRQLFYKNDNYSV